MGVKRLCFVYHTGFHYEQAVVIEAVAGGCLALANCASWDARNRSLRDSWPLRIGLSVAGLSLVAVKASTQSTSRHKPRELATNDVLICHCRVNSPVPAWTRHAVSGRHCGAVTGPTTGSVNRKLSPSSFIQKTKPTSRRCGSNAIMTLRLLKLPVSY